MSSCNKIAKAIYGKKYRADNADAIAARKAVWSKKRRAVKKEYVIISGKQKRVKYPDKIIAVLNERFTVSGCSETGLKWSDSAINKSWLRGQEAGYSSSDGYFFVTIVIDWVTYTIQVANIVWMLTHKQQIKEKFSKQLLHKKVFVLDIPDDYHYMDPALIELLKLAMQPYLK